MRESMRFCFRLGRNFVSISLIGLKKKFINHNFIIFLSFVHSIKQKIICNFRGFERLRLKLKFKIKYGINFLKLTKLIWVNDRSS